ncbi:MAG: hypothetical protein QM308_07755 [Bacillota bacterium]|nr:hypothetical protein [Bacillota bacterium]
MKKLLALALALVLALASLSALALGMTFTHPEVGEPMTIGYVNDMPFFKIYGFTYYQIVDPQTPYRGLLTNPAEPDFAKMPDLDTAINAMLDSAEGKDGGVPPLVFVTTGALESYQAYLEELSREDKVKALKLLNGFGGAEGYAELASIPGFEEEDFSEFSDNYVEFTVRIGEELYNYRVMQFYVEEKDFHEYYFERYNFIEVDGVWRLLRLTKEYADVTAEREAYVHGLTGYSLETAYDNNHDALMDLVWGDSLENALGIEGAEEENGQVVIKDGTVFRIPAKITFQFEDGLNRVEYVFNNELSFYAAFISLYNRYADPVMVMKNGDMTWSNNDTFLHLIYDKNAPSLVVVSEGEVEESF